MSPRQRWATIAVVVLVHVLAIYGLVRAFAPHALDRVVQVAISSFTVEVTPRPTPTPPPKPAASKSGAQGAAGRKAVPKAAAAPPAKIPISRHPAPKRAGAGSADQAGNAAAGAGTGAGGQGTGPGSGGDGDGAGNVEPARAVKTAGDINSTRDYPASTRDLRRNSRVVVAVTVGTDGRAHNCRVVRSSPDPEADRITCQLVEDRFRFRPATDRHGDPVASTYGWEQRWWDPRG